MSTLKIFAKLGPHTNQDALDGWLRGLAGLKEATFIREIDLELKDGIDMKALRRTLASCPFAEIVDHELLEEGAVGITDEGIQEITGKKIHEPQVTAQNADDVLLGWAEALNGAEYRDVLTAEQEELLKEAGIVLITGASDDITEFYGVYREELGAGDGATYFYWDGTEFHDEDAEDFEKPKNASCVVAHWCPDGKDMSWSFETDAPRFATFEIMEDDDCYGEGLLVYVADLTPQIEVVEEDTDSKDTQESKDGGEDEAGSDKNDEVDIASTESQEQKQDADVSPDLDIKDINFASDEAGEHALKFIQKGELSVQDVADMKGTGKDGGITSKNVKELVASLK